MAEAVGEMKRPLFRKVWWHVILTHFPISFFMISAAFMALHIVTDSACHETSAFLCLVAALEGVYGGRLNHHEGERCHSRLG